MLRGVAGSANQWFMIKGTKYIAIDVFMVIYKGLFPVCIAVTAFFFLDEKLTRVELVFFVIMMAGSVLGCNIVSAFDSQSKD